MARNLFEYHPDLGYRFIPGIRARVRHEAGGYMVRCNRAGFRCDHEVTSEKDPGSFRIILFGDSNTAGDGVSNGQRFGDLLENPAVGFEQAQVLNFGLPGSGTDQQLLAFRHFARDIDYDLLLICPLVENLLRNMVPARVTMNSTDGQYVRRAKPYFELRDGAMMLHHSPVPREAEPAGAEDVRAVSGGGSLIKRMLQPMIQGLCGRYPRLECYQQRLRGICHPPDYEDPQSPGWLLMQAILGAWIGEARAPVVIAPIPTFGHVFQCLRADGYRQRFAELGEATGADIADVLAAFLPLSARQRRACRFAVDDHPTPAGHQRIALSLAETIRPHYDRWKKSHGQ